MTSQKYNPFFSGLGWVQYVTLMLTIILSVISRPRQQILEISDQVNIPVEFRVISLSIPDFFVLGLLLLTVLRLLLVSDYRQHLMDTVNLIITRGGGLWWVLLVLWSILGMLWAGNTTMLRFGALHFIGLLVAAFILADLVQERGARLLLWALLISTAVQSVIALLQVLNNGPLGWYALGEIDRFYYDPTDFYRAPGLAMHYNYLAGYLMVGLFGCLLTGWQKWLQGKSVLLPALIGVLACVGILSTLSRGGMLATAVGLLPIGAVIFFALQRRIRLTVIAGSVGVVVLAAAYMLFALGGLENIQTRFFTQREFFFDYTWAVIQQSPVLGVGMGNLMLEAGRIWGLDVIHLLPVHNVYLFIWAEQGLPGLVLYLLGCFTILRRLHPRHGAAVFLWSCCFLAICTANLFDNYFWAVHPFRVVFFWVIGLWWSYACRDEVRAMIPEADRASVSAAGELSSGATNEGTA